MCVCVYTYLHMNMCACVYIYTHTYIYVYGCEMWHLVSTCVSQTWNILIPVLGLGVG